MQHRWMYPTRLTALGIAVLIALSGMVYLIAHEAPTSPRAQLRFSGASPELAHPLLPSASDTSPPSTEATRAAIDGALAGADVGSLSALVADAYTGQHLDARSADTAEIPASVTKLVTAAAVFNTVDPMERLTTRVVAGQSAGEVILVGGGDITLAHGDLRLYGAEAASLDDLAAQVRDALGGTPLTRMLVDSSLFSGPSISPHWIPDARGYVAPITPVMLNAGRTSAESMQRIDDPDLYAAQQLAALLGAPHAQIARAAEASDASARVLGSVESPPVATLTEWMLRQSNNTLAEVLARLAAKAHGQPASFDGVALALPAVLADLDVAGAETAVLLGGSGLSRGNQLSATTVTALLRRAFTEDNSPLRWLFAGLPIAGFDGTLNDRFTHAGSGEVRAKTGTLSKVVGLAGVAVTQSGHPVVFAFISNGSASAREPLDRAAAALTSLP